VSERVGILNIDKPASWTSHDVVARVRHLAGQKRVGHAGTLDPLATGVLPVLLGRATRLADFIQDGRKTYRAGVLLGVATDTDDADGATVATAEVPWLSTSDIDRALDAFRGEISQTPPRYSAVKIAGQRAYALARRGEDVVLVPRRVTIYDARVLACDSPTVQLEVTCSSGTYIRSVARDLAVALGTVGHLTSLVRTRVGPFALRDAATLDALVECGIDAATLPPSCALPDAPRIDITSADAARLRNGQTITIHSSREELVWIYDQDGVVCLGSAHGTLLRSRVLL
jgi:tRNA pseudouridine55 synthase